MNPYMHSAHFLNAIAALLSLLQLVSYGIVAWVFYRVGHAEALKAHRSDWGDGYERGVLDTDEWWIRMGRSICPQTDKTRKKER